MLRTPRRVDTNASGVGTQVSKSVEMLVRNLLVGAQC